MVVEGAAGQVAGPVDQLAVMWYDTMRSLQSLHGGHVAQQTSPDADRANFGVALYVDFAATEDDWTSYRKDWVRTS
ncbi:hypothetical protein ACFV2H_00795 [Streptomyces sp. NPDC059629]|uniref:hypothetical protein n=1 Tax=Streptomyces sp. NPDC059629 TaxID=3346889 RepID=UPI0036B1CE95